jgi:Spy/CpxP family protein refolding chaperone
VVGGLVGAAASRVLEARPAAPAGEQATGDACEQKDRDLLASLDLSPPQRERIDEILARRRQQADAFWQDAGPRLHELMDSTRAEIRTVLTPEQRAEYDRLRTERREARKQRESVH